MIWVFHPGSGSRFFTRPGSRECENKSDARSRVADPDYFGKLDPDPQESEKLDTVRFKVKKKIQELRS